MRTIHFFSIIILIITTKLSAQTVCQQQLEMNGEVSGISIGQSIFMAECSGFFTSIELYRNDDGEETTAELIILNGQTSLGTPRYTQTVAVPQGAGAFVINLGSGNGDLSFFEDSQYTFMLANTNLQLGANRDVDVYSNGQLFIDVGFINEDDLWFKLTTTTTLGLESGASNPVLLTPNPSNGQLQLSNNSMFNQMNVYSITGTLVAQRTLQEGDNHLYFNLNAGVYILELNGSNARTIKKLVIQ